MTLQECYVKIGGDYNDILHRFMNENMVRKFVLKCQQCSDRKAPQPRIRQP